MEGADKVKPAGTEIQEEERSCKQIEKADPFQNMLAEDLASATAELNTDIKGIEDLDLTIKTVQ